VVAEYKYDKASQLLSLVNRLNADTISKYNYQYDPVGNRIKMLEKVGVDSFTYDVLYRLTGAIHPQPSNPPENFDYDGVGNRITSHISTNYTYDSANRLLEDDQYQYRYDKNGNLVWKMSKASKKLKMLKSKSRGGFDRGVIKEEERTSGDSVVYLWNAENTLLGFVEYHLGDSAKMVSYKYDGLGRRIEKKVDTLVTKYVYDNEDIIFELDGNDSVVAIYTHGPGIDEPISVQRNGGKYYYHQDGLGSVTCITDTLGNVINTYLYDSFGNIKQKTGGLENPYTYTGREWDEESGIFYYRARYYDPRIGRFLSPDPIRLPKSMNSFWYVSNNSTNLSDPFGLSESGFWKFFPIFWDLWDFFWDPCWPEPSYEPPKPIQAKGPNPEAAEAWRMASGKDYLISGDYGVSGRGASQVLDPIKALIIANYETGDLKTFEQVYNQGIREGADFPGTAYSYYQYVFSEYWWFEVR
jgi:RHS repeat-associated protein